MTIGEALVEAAWAAESKMALKLRKNGKRAGKTAVRGRQMTVYCLNNPKTIKNQDSETTDKQRAVNRIVTETKPSSAGVDWQMIRSMRADRRYAETD